MNEQIASWFEELIPEIKETGDPRGTLLKFANEKNLAPALLERLGFIYNTAKTVNYLDKSASSKRGYNFKILDVPSLIEEYTSKQAAKKNHKYLAETVAEDIAKKCLQLDTAKSVHVSLKKPDIISGKTEVGVEVKLDK